MSLSMAASEQPLKEDVRDDLQNTETGVDALQAMLSDNQNDAKLIEMSARYKELQSSVLRSRKAVNVATGAAAAQVR
jgi:hypothetical protein